MLSQMKSSSLPVHQTHRAPVEARGQQQRRCWPRRLQRRTVQVAASAATADRPTEAIALAAYKATNPDTYDACLSLLKTAATTKSVAPEMVEGALVWLENNTAKGPVPSIDGKWRLVFSTSTSLRFFQYIPVKEDLCVDTSARTISLESEVWPFNFVIGGGLAAWRPDVGELDFQFSSVDILIFGKKIWTVNPTTKPKTYTFYFVGEQISTARSSAGGLSLMLK